MWEEERDLWRPDLSMAVAQGNSAERATALHRNADVTVIAIEHIKEVLAAKRSVPWHTLILDESSGYKSYGERFKTARSLLFRKGTTFRHCWQMTGTPSPNGLEGLWTQVFLLDRGQRLGKTLGEFRGRYFTPGFRLPTGAIIGRKPYPGMDERIHEKLEDVAISLTSEGRVELPPVVHNEVNITLPPVAVRAYRDLRDDMVANLDLIGGKTHTVKTIAILSSKLSQLTAGFLYEDQEWEPNPDDPDGPYLWVNKDAVTTVHREKAKAVREIVDGTGTPVIVFYWFKEERKILREMLPEATTPNDVKSGLQKKWNAGEIPVLLAHPASMSHGLNLQYGGHTIIWTTLPWSLEHWQQANKRLARPGQANPVLIHRIMARTPAGGATVDHLIHTRLTDKSLVQQALIEHLEAPI